MNKFFVGFACTYNHFHLIFGWCFAPLVYNDKRYKIIYYFGVVFFKFALTFYHFLND